MAQWPPRSAWSPPGAVKADLGNSGQRRRRGSLETGDWREGGHWRLERGDKQDHYYTLMTRCTHMHALLNTRLSLDLSESDHYRLCNAVSL